MEIDNIPYEKQIFVCTNDRQKEKPSCGDQNGETIFKELRRIAKERGLHPRIRVAQAKCLGQCSKGANIMIYPEGKWYRNVTVKDIEVLVAKYLTDTH